jgi:hypothetical protein
MLKKSLVIPGRPYRAGPGTHEHRPSHWILWSVFLGSGLVGLARARNDDVLTFFSTLLVLERDIFSRGPDRPHHNIDVAVGSLIAAASLFMII